jgi:hypothetical protein
MALCDVGETPRSELHVTGFITVLTNPGTLGLLEVVASQQAQQKLMEGLVWVVEAPAGVWVSGKLQAGIANRG